MEFWWEWSLPSYKTTCSEIKKNGLIRSGILVGMESPLLQYKTTCSEIKKNGLIRSGILVGMESPLLQDHLFWN